MKRIPDLAFPFRWARSRDIPHQRSNNRVTRCVAIAAVLFLLPACDGASWGGSVGQPFPSDGIVAPANYALHLRFGPVAGDGGSGAGVRVQTVEVGDAPAAVFTHVNVMYGLGGPFYMMGGAGAGFMFGPPQDPGEPAGQVEGGLGAELEFMKSSSGSFSLFAEGTYSRFLLYRDDPITAPAIRVGISINR